MYRPLIAGFSDSVSRKQAGPHKLEGRAVFKACQSVALPGKIGPRFRLRDALARRVDIPSHVVSLRRV